ncbi:MAG: M24 family metallopeptidase [Ardenticatenia bacterium]|nr:M24 family metallopeptidase [Ardenticatenia bacterium]
MVDTPFYREDWVVADEVRVASDLVEATLDVLRSLRGCRVGLADGELLPVPLWWAWESQLEIAWEPVDRLLWPLRRVKDAYELAMLRRAARVAAVGLQAASEAAVVGATEAEVCAAGVAAALKAGADFVRYLRVHSGPWSAWGSRWPQATARRLQPGDLVVLDIIGAVNGYAFDVLRTVAVGTPTDDHARLLEAVQAAVEVAIASARPGVVVRHLCERARSVLVDAGFPDAARFVGHGIGLETVEPPYLREDQEETLLAGEVLCVEPAVWRLGWGGASLEEEVVVGNPPEVITRTA